MSTGGLLKGVNPRASDRFSVRPTATNLSDHETFCKFCYKIHEIGGVPADAKVDYVTLHLLEGEDRTWFDLRVKSIPTETFDSVSAAICFHFASTNSQQHYHEALQSLCMEQFPDVMACNQAFRQMLLCLEDMSETNKLIGISNNVDFCHRRRHIHTSNLTNGNAKFGLQSTLVMSVSVMSSRHSNI